MDFIQISLVPRGYIEILYSITGAVRSYTRAYLGLQVRLKELYLWPKMASANAI